MLFRSVAAGQILLWLDVPVPAMALIAFGAGNGIFFIARGTVPLAMFGAEGYGAVLGLIATPILMVNAFSPSLFAFIVVGLYRDRALLDASLLPLLAIVIAQNGAGLALGDLCARAFRLPSRARRAIVIEAGMQNSGLALGIIALQFGGDLGMVVIASLWGIWHIVTGLGLAFLWRRHDVRHGL